MAHLYRVRDSQGTLLYIGITECLFGRFINGHQHSARWWPDMAALSVAWYPDMQAAGAAEREAIAAEIPLWNRAGSPERRLARLADWGPRPWLGPDREQEREAQYELAESLIRKALADCRGW